MKSRLYTGNVTHKRFEPFIHGFQYKIFMAYLDLDEIDNLMKDSLLFSSKLKAVMEFRRSDYLGDPDVPLDSAVRDEVEQQTGVYPDGPIRMLTHLRTFGYVFNPVTFYYCYDKEGENVLHIVVQITNTPWKERHSYVLSPEKNLSKEKGWYRYLIDKEFHVSPFMDMNYHYDMNFTLPSENLNVQISNMRESKRKFIAVLNLNEEEFSKKNLINILVRFPLITFKVIVAIYWQALKLKLKGATYFPNTGKKEQKRFKEAA